VNNLGIPLPKIPEENLHLFEAASTTDVFDVMGSCNESLAYMANEKKMDNRNLSAWILLY